MDGVACDDTFHAVDGKMAFKDRSASTNVGIIVAGSKLIGPSQTCEAVQVHRKEDRVTVSLRCEDAILESDTTVSFRMLGEDRFERLDPFFGDALATYSRCPE